MTRSLYLLIVLTAIELVTPTSVAADGILNRKTKWKFKTDGSIRSAVLINGTQLFMGSGDGNLYSLNKAVSKALEITI